MCYEGGMTLHIFQSSGSPELFGFTAAREGANLPASKGRWESVGDAIPLGVAMASASPKIGEEVEATRLCACRGPFRNAAGGATERNRAVMGGRRARTGLTRLASP
jgi:hypothetical protein